jgi:hypothetical protein
LCAVHVPAPLTPGTPRFQSPTNLHLPFLVAALICSSVGLNVARKLPAPWRKDRQEREGTGGWTCSRQMIVQLKSMVTWTTS